MSNPAVGALRQSGSLFALGLDVVRSLPRRPFQTKEFIQQSWFIASVTILPTALVSIPFGAVITLQLGNDLMVAIKIQLKRDDLPTENTINRVKTELKQRFPQMK